MAFQSVNVSGTKKATEIEIGGELVGYITGFEENRINPDSKNILMKLVDGNSIRLYTSGNLKYMLKDNKIQVGLLTKIVRLADKNVKGKMSSQFDVLQDPEQTLEDALFEAVSAAPAKVVTSAVEKASRLASENTSARSSGRR